MATAKTPEQKAAEKRAKLVAELEALNVTLTGEETDEELAAKLKEAKPEAPKAPAPTEVKVYHRDHRGRGTVRVFSKEIHGEDFAKVADEFKASNASKVIENEQEGIEAIQRAAELEAEDKAKAAAK